MLATINPSARNIDATLNTLRYAERVRQLGIASHQQLHHSYSSTSLVDEDTVLLDEEEPPESPVFEKILVNAHDKQSVDKDGEESLKQDIHRMLRELAGVVDKHNCDREFLETLHSELAVLCEATRGATF